MNSSILTLYKSMRDLVVQYLKSKHLWKRSAGTTFGSTATGSASGGANPGPVPMDVGSLDGQDQAGKSKGKTSGQKGGQNNKGGKKGGTKGEGKGKEKGRGTEMQKKQMAKEDIVQFAALTKVKTIQPKSAISTPGHIPKVIAKEERKDPETQHRRCS